MQQCILLECSLINLFIYKIFMVAHCTENDSGQYNNQ